MSKYFNFKFKYSLFPLHRPSISTSLPTGLLCFHFSSHLFSPLVSLYKPIANCHFIRTFPFSHSLVQFHSFNSFCSSSSFVTIQCIYSTKYNSHFIYYNPSTRSPLVSSLTKLGILLTSSFYFDLRSPPTAPHTSYFNRLWVHHSRTPPASSRESSWINSLSGVGSTQSNSPSNPLAPKHTSALSQTAPMTSSDFKTDNFSFTSSKHYQMKTTSWSRIATPSIH